MRSSDNDYVSGRDASTPASGHDQREGSCMDIRIRGRRTTGAPTSLLHFGLQPGFEADSKIGVTSMCVRSRSAMGPVRINGVCV